MCTNEYGRPASKASLDVYCTSLLPGAVALTLEQGQHREREADLRGEKRGLKVYKQECVRVRV